MRFYDAHNHLQSVPADSWETLLPAIKVAGAVCNGTSESDWSQVAALAQKHRWIQPSYGLHPWFIAERSPDWLETLQHRLDQGGCLGEIGLDRWHEPTDFSDQQRVFQPQLALAVERDLPVTIHCLKAWGDLYETLRAAPTLPRGFLLHAYGGSVEMVESFLPLGAYFSFNGYFLHPRKTAARAAFEKIPLDRLMVETDAPAMLLPPEFQRYALPEATANHPANLIVAYEELAKLKKIPLTTLTEIVAENYHRFFSL
jgi:TatD DNase family protein